MCCIQGGIVTEVVEGLTGFLTSNNYLSNGKKSSDSFVILRQNSTNSC